MSRSDPITDEARANTHGAVRVHQDDRGVVFQVVGWGRMQQSLPVRRLGEQALAAGLSTIQIDLRECTYLDSTFLGTLLYLKRAALRRHGRFLLISPSSECCRLFKQLGIEDCFTAVADCPAVESWRELPCAPDDVAAFNQNVIQAHQELAGLGGAAGRAFQAVARCLEAEKTDP
jgi:anti-anti-sigma factor